MSLSNIYLGADHGGYELKEHLKHYFDAHAIVYQDIGNTQLEPEDDYPDFAAEVATRVAGDFQSRGILICGGGAGVCIVANKFSGIRAVQAHTKEIAAASRADDDTNVLCLAGRFITLADAETIVAAWLDTPFKQEAKYQRRIDKITTIEQKQS